MEEIRKALDNNEFSCDVFLDFQKTFGTVNHKILIDKIHYYGARGITLNIILTKLSHYEIFQN